MKKDNFRFCRINIIPVINYRLSTVNQAVNDRNVLNEEAFENII
jgi:hypothetical protein